MQNILPQLESITQYSPELVKSTPSNKRVLISLIVTASTATLYACGANPESVCDTLENTSHYESIQELHFDAKSGYHHNRPTIEQGQYELSENTSESHMNEESGHIKCINDGAKMYPDAHETRETSDPSFSLTTPTLSIFNTE